jgi:hypothetical protein
MPMDFLTLLHRDHEDLGRGLDELVAAEDLDALRSALDGIRLGLVAHVEAEDIVLYHALTRSQGSHGGSRRLGALVEAAHGEHVMQERTLTRLVCSTPCSLEWFDAAHRLRDLVREHAEREEAQLLPVLRDAMPRVYDTLAGEFATERLRQLAMLAPSQPIFMPVCAAS